MKLGVFTGLAGLDTVYYQDHVPLENQKSKTNDYDVFVGGPAANAAITYAMLGGQAILITCIGDSAFGRVIKKQLVDDYGVEILDLAEGSEGLPSMSGISINKANGNRTIWSGQSLYTINNDPRTETNVQEAMKQATFCFSDCNLPEVSVQVLLEAKKQSKKIILDAGSWKEHSHFYLSVAEDAIASAVCKPLTHPDFFAAAIEYGVKNVAVTNGSEEIQWKSMNNQTINEQGSITPPRVNTKDTLGAGDIFHGAYCFFNIVKNLSFPDSLEKAAEVASLSVTFFGPREGVKEYLRK